VIGADRISASTAWVAAGLMLAVAASATGASAAGGDQQVVMWAAAGAAVGGALAYFAWYTDPAYILTAGIMLSVFGGNWPAMGIPGPLSPDRLLLLAGVGAVILRAPAVRDRPRFRIEAVHWVLGAAVLYATFSAVASGTLTERGSFFRLFDAFGVLPFLIFLVAPLAFRTRRQRLVLLAGLVALGGYLGLTALFQATGLDPLVFPKYILDPNYGIHRGRVRGPFAEATTNGVGLYVCAVAAAIALISWQKRGARLIAASVGGLCLMGTVLGLERSVWLGAVLGTVVTVMFLPDGRRMFMRIVPSLVIAFAIALAAVPNLRAQISERFGDKGTIYTRQNLNRATLNMVAARPMFGFGWGAYSKQGADYFQQSSNYPLANRISRSPPHNLFLDHAAELGLLGVGLWMLGLGLVVAGALSVRGPPDLDLWRTGLIPVTIFVIVLLNFIPGGAGFTTRALCLWAGVVWSGRYFEREDR
jgi:putative inorganic carbon (hco3(-)) transporter